MRYFAALITAVLLPGCGGSPCVEYLDAQQACYDTLDEPNPLAEKNTYCRDYTAEADPYFSCLTEAFDAADCSTTDGLSGAIDAAATCSQD